MDNTLFPEKAAALRDFFASAHAGDLRSSAAEVARRFDLDSEPPPDWLEVEYDFNRLFVGPAAVPAPPYASAYRQEPSLMGRATLEVRDAYRVLGLAVPDLNATPDDHLAFELDAVVAMASPVVGDAARGPLRAWLVDEHMAEWIPRFADAVRAQPAVSGTVRMAVEALMQWLESVTPETISVHPDGVRATQRKRRNT